MAGSAANGCKVDPRLGDSWCLETTESHAHAHDSEYLSRSVCAAAKLTNMDVRITSRKRNEKGEKQPQLIIDHPQPPVRTGLFNAKTHS